MNLPLTQYRGLLGVYLKPQRNGVVLLAVLVLGSIGLQLLNPQIIRYFIDTAQSGGAQRELLIAALVFLAIGLIQRAPQPWWLSIWASASAGRRPTRCAPIWRATVCGSICRSTSSAAPAS